VGYEVMDTEGGQVHLPHESVPPSQVVDLSDLVAPGPAPTDRSGLPRQADGPQRRPGRGGTDRLPPWARRVLAGSLIWPLCIAALVGVIAGGWWSQHHAAEQAAAERDARLSAIAIVTQVDATRAQRAADYTVKIINAGPLPLELVSSPPGSQPSVDHPVVRKLGGASVVPAGGALSANVRVAVDCEASSEPVDEIRVPLRTTDGVVHELPVTDQSGLDPRASIDSPCADPEAALLSTHLTGTVSEPVLTLENTSDADIVVSLDLEHSPFIEQSTNFSVLRLRPPLPQVLGPHQSLPVKLTLAPWSCPQNLAEVANGQLSPYIVLRAGPPDTAPLIQEPVGVDLSTLWGAALARDCS
jgi:hypothetical protein